MSLALTLYDLTVRNFMPFGNGETVIDLQTELATLIVGINHDATIDGQLESNGAGKTSIRNAINVAFYDGIVSDKKINLDDMINDTNKKDMMVGLRFSVDDEFMYKIVRYRRNKALGGNGVRLYRAEQAGFTGEFTEDHDITPDSTANTNQLISRIIGMSQEVFSRIVAISGNDTSFLHLSASDQVSVVEDISGLSEISQKADALHKDIKANKIAIESLSKINDTIKAQRSQIEAQIQSVLTRMKDWDVELMTKVSKLKDRFDKMEEDSIDYDEQIRLFSEVTEIKNKLQQIESDIHAAKNKVRYIDSTVESASAWEVGHRENISKKRAALRDIEEIDYDQQRAIFDVIEKAQRELTDLTNTLARKEQTIEQHRRDSTKKSNELASLNASLCPYCEQHFKSDQNKKNALKSELDKLAMFIGEEETEIDRLGLDVVDLKAIIACEEPKLFFPTIKGLEQHAQQFSVLSKGIELLEEQKNPYPDIVTLEVEREEYLDKIDALNEELAKTSNKLRAANKLVAFDTIGDVYAEKQYRDSVLKDMAAAADAINPHAATFNELSAMVVEKDKDEELEEMRDMLEHQQFLYKLLTKKDSFIRKALLQKSLPFLNSRLRVYLDKIGFNYSVVFQEDLTAKISRFKNTIGFNNLSTGQRARVNIAISFAFRDMLQMRHGKINFCILDECLDYGLSNVGVQLATKMVKGIAETDRISMFVVSHRDELTNMFDKKLLVELRNGFATVTQ